MAKMTAVEVKAFVPARIEGILDFAPGDPTGDLRRMAQILPRNEIEFQH
jgi:hypothetical protein